MNRLLSYLWKAASLVLAVVVSSCALPWIDPAVNISPNSPTDAPIQVILAPNQVRIGYIMGGDIGRYNSLFTQHHRGVDRQHTGIWQFLLTESDVNTAWNGLYEGVMNDLTRIIQKANAQNLPAYRGIARVLMAFCLGNATDLWNNIPYDEAFRGYPDASPRYQTQEQIYGIIQNLLDSAIIDLNNANPGGIVPGAGQDFIYRGNRANWIRAAWSLKARYHIHLTKVNRTQAAQNALAALQGNRGINANAVDCQVPFGSAPTEANPWFQFMAQRNDIRLGPQMVNMLNALNDPRRPVYSQGQTMLTDGVSTLGPLYASANSPVPLITYAETKFIEAEAQLILGNNAAAKAAYVEGIRASLQRAGVSEAGITTYLGQTNVVPAGDVTLQNIIEQKYLALYTQTETYNDWRRTGFPVLDPTRVLPMARQQDIPRRWPYPQDERLFNKNFPGQVNITDRVWWDRP
ncbi:MAG: SusD/RagB family nutrient-binding outer membrane lipoprotein [Bacteroidota bacterium]|nr:SusD/RagB family nutrient-binding outer membrane lipoprotein [Candidatus Kapabacteria bacterium]MDW8220266.1 SusD/RagB family nutrient-binding outer membrane lipoprotein [Bacteroidota bacterium]